MKEFRSPFIVSCYGVQEYPLDRGKVVFYVLMEYCSGASGARGGGYSCAHTACDVCPS